MKLLSLIEKMKRPRKCKKCGKKIDCSNVWYCKNCVKKLNIKK